MSELRCGGKRASSVRIAAAISSAESDAISTASTDASVAAAIFSAAAICSTAMPPDLPKKSSQTQGLLLLGLFVVMFVIVVSFLVWGIVFGAPGVNKVLPILLLSAGLLMTGINAALVVRKLWRIKKSTKTTGMVMNVEVSQGMQQLDYSSTRNTLFKPTVRFQTADGRIIDYTPNMSSSWSNRHVGENVPVYYDPQQPEEPIVGKLYNLWFPHFLFGIVGGGFLLIGTLFMSMSSKFPQ